MPGLGAIWPSVMKMMWRLIGIPLGAVAFSDANNPVGEMNRVPHVMPTS